MYKSSTSPACETLRGSTTKHVLAVKAFFDTNPMHTLNVQKKDLSLDLNEFDGAS